MSMTAADWDRIGEVFDAGANAYRGRPGHDAHAAAQEAMASRCHIIASRVSEADAHRGIPDLSKYAPPGPAEFVDPEEVRKQSAKSLRESMIHVTVSYCDVNGIVLWTTPLYTLDPGQSLTIAPGAYNISVS
jgi:hypothetical protein